MRTIIYMVRHGESPKTEGNERTRGLTQKGKSEANRITEILKGAGIEFFVSSPYQRAILTVQELARSSGQEIIVFEDLKERIIFSENTRMPDEDLYPLLKKSFSDPTLALPGGESNAVCLGQGFAEMQILFIFLITATIGNGIKFLSFMTS